MMFDSVLALPFSIVALGAGLMAGAYFKRGQIELSTIPLVLSAQPAHVMQIGRMRSGNRHN